ILLALVFLLNLAKLLGVGSSAELPAVAWIPLILISLMAPVVLFWLRFPYVERREAFFKLYPRYKVNLPAHLVAKNGTHEAFLVALVEISESGALVSGVPLAGQGETQWVLEIPDLNLQLPATRAREISESVLTLRWDERLL